MTKTCTSQSSYDRFGPDKLKEKLRKKIANSKEKLKV